MGKIYYKTHDPHCLLINIPGNGKKISGPVRRDTIDYSRVMNLKCRKKNGNSKMGPVFSVQNSFYFKLSGYFFFKKKWNGVFCIC